MKSDGNGDFERIDHGFYHIRNGLETAHIFARALGNTENNGGTKFFRGEKNRFCPFKVVDVEMAYGVFAGFGLVEHFFC